ncbi:MAG TPA: S8 family serine peptidase [Longimicrobium sp.]|nr:S8 family serine peptidase [Longimicrobium sp.]
MQSCFGLFGRPARAGYARWLTAPMVAAPLLLGACDDRSLPLEPAGEPAAASLVASPTIRTAEGDLVTSDAAAFAQALAEIGPEGKVLIWLKETGTARPSAEFLLNLPGSSPETIALPADAPGASRRNDLGAGSVRGASLNAVVRALTQAGVNDPNPMQALGVISARLPERVRLAALQVLLRHPNVDYVSAVRAEPAEFHGDPLGLNSPDVRHTMHQVTSSPPYNTGVWSETRGAGIKIGVIDSGLARVTATGSFHEDALFTTTTFNNFGVVALGFVDDECGSTSANNGSCIANDDDGHGSAMVGLVGANDNDVGGVGIAPYATTYSMKVAWDTHIRGHCGDNPFNDSSYCIENDDYIRAINYAAAQRFHVLLISFSKGSNSDVYRALSTAYHTYGVFLVASTGNTVGGSAQYPANYDVVMGVGGVDVSGNNLYSTAARDVSGYAGGYTLQPSCLNRNAYCDAGSPGLYGGATGTSAAAANVAGVVALVRACYTTETPAQIWTRVVNSAEGVNRVVKAYAAMNYDCPTL